MDNEGSALPRITGNFNPSPQFFDYAVTDRQPKTCAHSIFFRAEKRIEDLAHQLLGDSRSVIRYTRVDLPLAGIESGSYDDLP